MHQSAEFDTLFLKIAVSCARAYNIPMQHLASFPRLHSLGFAFGISPSVSRWSSIFSLFPKDRFARFHWLIQLIFNASTPTYACDRGSVHCDLFSLCIMIHGRTWDVGIIPTIRSSRPISGCLLSTGNSSSHTWLLLASGLFTPAIARKGNLMSGERQRASPFSNEN